jgi:hypothetical protein
VKPVTAFPLIVASSREAPSLYPLSLARDTRERLVTLVSSPAVARLVPARHAG